MSSPLVGTAGVIAALCFVSIPLRELTSGSTVKATAPIKAETKDETIPAVIRLKVLDPAAHLSLEGADGGKLIDVHDLKAGTSEYDVDVRMTGNKLNLKLMADFGVLAEDTAVFVTLMPAGQDDRTRYSTGNGMLQEKLMFDWNHAD